MRRGCSTYLRLLCFIGQCRIRLLLNFNAISLKDAIRKRAL
jgi:hypothetical protein